MESAEELSEGLLQLHHNTYSRLHLHIAYCMARQCGKNYQFFTAMEQYLFALQPDGSISLDIGHSHTRRVLMWMAMRGRMF